MFCGGKREKQAKLVRAGDVEGQEGQKQEEEESGSAGNILGQGLC